METLPKNNLWQNTVCLKQQIYASQENLHNRWLCWLRHLEGLARTCQYVGWARTRTCQFVVRARTWQSVVSDDRTCRRIRVGALNALTYLTLVLWYQLWCCCRYSGAASVCYHGNDKKGGTGGPGHWGGAGSGAGSGAKRQKLLPTISATRTGGNSWPSVARRHAQRFELMPRLALIQHLLAGVVFFNDPS